MNISSQVSNNPLRKCCWGFEILSKLSICQSTCVDITRSYHQRRSFSACFPFPQDTMLHVSSLHLTLRACGSLQLCVCVGAWVFAHTLLNSKQLLLWHTACISVPVCCQGPHALIKSNLIQMLHPPAAPTRHQPIKQAPPRPLPCDFKIG